MLGAAYGIGEGGGMKFGITLILTAVMIMLLLALTGCHPCWTGRDVAQRSDCSVL